MGPRELGCPAEGRIRREGLSGTFDVVVPLRDSTVPANFPRSAPRTHSPQCNNATRMATLSAPSQFRSPESSQGRVSRAREIRPYNSSRAGYIKRPRMAPHSSVTFRLAASRESSTALHRAKSERMKMSLKFPGLPDWDRAAASAAERFPLDKRPKFCIPHSERAIEMRACCRRTNPSQLW